MNEEAASKEVSSKSDSEHLRRRLAVVAVTTSSVAATATALGKWVKGVEVDQKAKVEAKILSEKRYDVLTDLTQFESELKTASLAMKTAHRNLPSRQEELNKISALEQKAAADVYLKQRRVDVCDLLAFTSLNGHNALSFAAGLGNERAIRILISRGANATGHSVMSTYIISQFLYFYVCRMKNVHLPPRYCKLASGITFRNGSTEVH